ncbi:MAG: hypothetical protein L0H94_07770 [Nitrospira sp.]|nr:hypothetical protein [Nitrospira sp.]
MSTKLHFMRFASPELSSSGLSRGLPYNHSHRDSQRGAEPYRREGLSIKKELLTMKELAAELRLSPKSI